MQIVNVCYCDCCEKDITFRTRIQCAVCKEFDICAICFEKGLEVKDHKTDHEYHII